MYGVSTSKMTELKWGIYAGCINEEKLIEAKINWALNRGMAVSICEGHHPNYKNVNEKGLSTDKTTEILESYADRINYIAKGPVPHQMFLRDEAYLGLPKDSDVVIMSDIDEFVLDKDLERLDKLYKRRKDLVLTLTNSLIFLDNEHCCVHVMNSAGGHVKYNRQFVITMGHWHERIFRYSKYNRYRRSPFLVNDYLGRFPFSDSAYFDDRMLIPDIYIMHYKNFKMEEAKKRHEMYKERGDKADYSLEWDILESNKFKYKGEHPQEIMELMKNG